MPQQINLCTPMLLPQKRPFAANTMVMALAAFLIVGGGLCAYWVSSLNSSSQSLQTNLNSLNRDRESLVAVIKSQQAVTGGKVVDPNLEMELLQAQLVQRERLLTEMRRGLLIEGQGHAARLRLVAETIPSQVWVTELVADEYQMEVRGYTFVPSALNDWVARLAINPVLEGQTLSAINVARVNTPAPNTAVSSATAGDGNAPPAWSFTLVSARSNPPVMLPGGKS
jgi:Tfp pilus assembly protein PilN